MNNDLISRQAAIDALNEEYHGMISDESMKIYKIIEWLGELPSAQPEVIRCKDCKHWKDSDGVFRRGIGVESKCPLNLHQVYEGTFYCGIKQPTIPPMPKRPVFDARDTQYNLPIGTDCISRQAAIDALGELPTFTQDWSYNTWMYTDDVYNAIKQLPPIQPKRGRWIKLDMHRGMADHKCSVCEQECYVPTCMGEPMYAYCPNCGADMRGEQNG